MLKALAAFTKACPCPVKTPLLLNLLLNPLTLTDLNLSILKYCSLLVALAGFIYFSNSEYE